jgi:NitT/TauT family transport system ATP-binding protein
MNDNIFNPSYGEKKEEKVVELPPIVTLQGIRQYYSSTGETVFDNFNLSIPDIPEKGQFVTIMGSSGCGKSTLLRYISGLQKPTSGKILFRGQEADRKKSVPMVFQQYTNLEWKTVLNNVKLPLDIQGVDKAEAETRAMEILKVVGLESHANQYAKYPLLSGGQLQRVAIARGLVMNPDILLMDEPFGALDVKTRQDMQIFLRSIFEAKEDMTIILVTHSVSEAVFLSDKIIVLGNKPAQIVQDIDVSLGDVRSESVIGTEEFKEYEITLRKALGL